MKHTVVSATIVLLAMLVVGSEGLAAAEVPLTVSPGSLHETVLIESRCPTFSWGTVTGAGAFDLAVYRLGVEPQDAEPVLRQRLPGSVSSWTPALGRSLASGGRYAWSMRTVGDDGESEWSDPRLFEISGVPTRAEVERALETLRSYLAAERLEDRVLARTSEGPASARARLPRASAASPRASRVPAQDDFAGISSWVPDVAPGTVEGRVGVLGIAGESGSNDPARSIGVEALSLAEFGVGISAEGYTAIEGYSRGGLVASLTGEQTAQGLWVSSEACCDGRVLQDYPAVIWNESDGLSDDPDVLALGVDQFLPGANTNFIGFFDLLAADSTPEIVGEIEADGLGGVHFTGSAASLLGPGADFAEYLPRFDPTEPLLPGDVVGVHSGAVSRRTEGADQILVVTSKPLVLGRRPPPEEVDRFVAVALLGQVPVRISGTVAAGDYLVASGENDGKAVAVARADLASAHLPALIGRALVEADPGADAADALVGVFDSTLVADLVRPLRQDR